MPFPNRVADQTGVEPVADAHQCRFLFNLIKSFQILKAIRDRILDEPIHFQMPEVDVHARIDHVLGHAIE